MVDRLFSEPRLAELYDALCAGRPDWAFYLPLVMKAESVLDVGCGTGELLRLAREHGHTGRLCGMDPAAAMLDIAKRRPDIDWVLGDLRSIRWSREFDLVVMTGNAFQVLVEDEELHTALLSIWSALTVNGRFAFETRNPSAREWERWGPREVKHEGIVVQASGPPPLFDGKLLSFTTVFTSPAWEGPEVSKSTLRVFGVEELGPLLADAGLVIEAQYGDFDYQPLTDSSLEIVTVARRANTTSKNP